MLVVSPSLPSARTTSGSVFGVGLHLDGGGAAGAPAAALSAQDGHLCAAHVGARNREGAAPAFRPRRPTWAGGRAPRPPIDERPRRDRRGRSPRTGRAWGGPWRATVISAVRHGIEAVPTRPSSVLATRSTSIRQFAAPAASRTIASRHRGDTGRWPEWRSVALSRMSALIATVRTSPFGSRTIVSMSGAAGRCPSAPDALAGEHANRRIRRTEAVGQRRHDPSSPIETALNSSTPRKAWRSRPASTRAV